MHAKLQNVAHKFPLYRSYVCCAKYFIDLGVQLSAQCAPRHLHTPTFSVITVCHSSFLKYGSSTHTRRWQYARTDVHSSIHSFIPERNAASASSRMHCLNLCPVAVASHHMCCCGSPNVVLHDAVTRRAPCSFNTIYLTSSKFHICRFRGDNMRFCFPPF
jgi:hypothetical protein